MKTYNKPRLFSFSRSHAVVPTAVLAQLPAVNALAQSIALGAAEIAAAAISAKKMIGDNRSEKDVDALIPVEVI